MKKEGGKGIYQGWGLGIFCLVGREQRRKGKGELVAWWSSQHELQEMS